MTENKMMNVEKLQRMAREFAEEYSTKGGLLDLTVEHMTGLNQIQVKRDWFLETFGDQEYKVDMRTCESYPFEYSYIVGNCKFLCLVDIDHKDS